MDKHLYTIPVKTASKDFGMRSIFTQYKRENNASNSITEKEHKKMITIVPDINYNSIKNKELLWALNPANKNSTQSFLSIDPKSKFHQLEALHCSTDPYVDFQESLNPKNTGMKKEQAREETLLNSTQIKKEITPKLSSSKMYLPKTTYQLMCEDIIT